MIGSSIVRRVRPPLRFVASLRFAMVVVGTLAAALAWGTFVESRSGTAMARMAVYDRGWFQVLLGALFANVLAAVLVRLPLRPGQRPFAAVHAGILLLLAGAFVTRWKGVEGVVEITEGRASQALRTSELVVRVYRKGWMASETAVEGGFLPSSAATARIPILGFLPFSRTIRRVASDPAGDALVEFALERRGEPVLSGRMGLGDPSLSAPVARGPLRVVLERADDSAAFLDSAAREAASGPATPTELLRLGALRGALLVRLESGGRLLAARPVVAGREEVLPGGLRLVVGKYLPRGILVDSCVPAQPDPGPDAPGPAVRIGSGPWGAPRWIPLGGTASWIDSAGPAILSLERRRLSLPFLLRLDSFRIGTDPGSADPAGFESTISVMDSTGMTLGSAGLSMNRPMRRGGFVFCQSAFTAVPGAPARVELTANLDPGRPWKYAGGLLVVVSIGWYVLQRPRRGTTEGA